MKLGVNHMRRFHALFVVALIVLPVLPVQAGSSWRTGTYLLKGTNGNSGTLIIHSSYPKPATFSMQIETCRRDCETDTPYANVGTIDQGTMEISGDSGRYRSAGPNEETQAPELGICVLQFSRSRGAITVTQLSTCWWFGNGVYASGTFVLMPTHAAK